MSELNSNSAQLQAWLKDNCFSLLRHRIENQCAVSVSNRSRVKPTSVSWKIYARFYGGLEQLWTSTAPTSSILNGISVILWRGQSRVQLCTQIFPVRSQIPTYALKYLLRTLFLFRIPARIYLKLNVAFSSLRLPSLFTMAELAVIMSMITVPSTAANILATIKRRGGASHALVGLAKCCGNTERITANAG